MHDRLAVAGRLAVGFVLGEGRAIGFEQIGLALDDEHVLGIFNFRLVREIEAAGNQHAAVDDNDFVVGDGVLSVDVRGQAVVNQVAQFGVRLLLVTLIEDDLDINASALGFDQGVGDGFGGEGIGLNQHFFAGSPDFPNHRVSASSLG